MTYDAWLERHGLARADHIAPGFAKGRGKPLSPAELKQRRDAARGTGNRGAPIAAAARRKQAEREFSAMLDAKQKRIDAATRKREEFEQSEAARLRSEGKLGPRNFHLGDVRLMENYKRRVNDEMRAGAELIRRPHEKPASSDYSEVDRRRESLGLPYTMDGRYEAGKLYERAVASRTRQRKDFDALVEHMGITPWASGDARRPGAKPKNPSRRQRDATVAPFE